MGRVVVLTKALALARAGRGIRVNAVAFGYTETTIDTAGAQLSCDPSNPSPTSPFCE
jgi:NAD(P)-dependent dehydrogenase (short-subunit alcohol dehydrogenase family)